MSESDNDIVTLMAMPLPDVREGNHEDTSRGFDDHGGGDDGKPKDTSESFTIELINSLRASPLKI